MHAGARVLRSRVASLIGVLVKTTLSASTVRIGRDGAVAMVTIDHEHKLNALDSATIDALSSSTTGSGR
jgi:hypothetical protein